MTALDKATNRSQHITITASSGLTDAEVDSMRKDAESHAEEDRRRKELIEVRNTADNAIYTSEKTLRDLGDKVPGDLRSRVEDNIGKLRQALGTDNAENIRSATDALMRELQQIGAAAYQQAGPEGGAPGGPETPGPGGPSPEEGGEDVVDGEFRSV